MALGVWVNEGFALKEPSKNHADEAVAVDAKLYVIEPGDKVNIEVYREKDMCGVFTVNTKGYIAYPLLGDIYVEGLTLDEMRFMLTDALGSKYLVNPQIQINFEESPNKSVSILGSVNRPGNYILTPNTTIVRLISKVGGFTGEAAEDSVKILRETEPGKKTSFDVNVLKIARGEDPDFKLRPGDMIFVEKVPEKKGEISKQTASLFGQVNRPGNYAVSPGLTLIRLISEAGGFTGLAVQSQVRVVRRTPDGKDKTFIVNAARILNGSAPDVPIEVGDIIVIPESFF